MTRYQIHQFYLASALLMFVCIDLLPHIHHSKVNRVTYLRTSKIDMAQTLPLCLTVLVVSLYSVSLIYAQGSTPHLKEIVLGRCWDFQRQKKHAVSAKNCSKIWETFYAAWAYKDPCKTTFADYKPYFDEVGMDIVRPNKVNIK